MRELRSKPRMRNKSLYRIPVQGLFFLHKSTSTDTFFYDPSDLMNSIFSSTSLYPKGSSRSSAGKIFSLYSRNTISVNSFQAMLGSHLFQQSSFSHDIYFGVTAQVTQVGKNEMRLHLTSCS